MKYIIKIFVMIIVLSSSQLNAQFRLTNKSDDYKIISEKEFNKNSLWGHINGGADIYLEYGFENLLVQEINLGGENIKVEIYQMDEAKSAYGIFSLYSSNSDSKHKDILFSSLNKYHVQAAFGNYYISIINSTGTEEAKEKCLKILGILTDKKEVGDFKLPILIRNLLDKNPDLNIKLLRGKLSFENYASEYDFFAEKSLNTDKYYLSYRTQERTISVILLPDITMNDFGKMYSNDDKTKQLEENQSLNIVYNLRMISIERFDDNNVIISRSQTDFDELKNLLSK